MKVLYARLLFKNVTEKESFSIELLKKFRGTLTSNIKKILQRQIGRFKKKSDILVS